MEIEDLTLKRFYVKICAGPHAGGNPCIYASRDFPFDLFMKWKWYFDYRAALYKVQNPRHYVDMLTGKYDYVPPFDVSVKTLKNKISGVKAMITKDGGRLESAKQHLNNEVIKKGKGKLFFNPNEDPEYIDAVTVIEKFSDKVENKRLELLQLEEKLKLLLSKGITHNSV